MVLEKFSNSLKNTITSIKNTINVDRQKVEEIIKEIQKALLTSDVNVRLVLELCETIRKRAIKEDISEITKSEHLTTIIYEELVKFLGEGVDFELKKDIQNRILLVGLYGAGKTTTCAKLANYFKQREQKVALISTDTYRSAAYLQLKTLGDSILVDVYGDKKEKDALKIYENNKKNLEKYDLVIIDSCGRDNLNEELVKEIVDLNKLVNPTDIFLTIGADIGQNAKKQAEAFKEKLNISGVIITKLDGTGKAGGALSACQKTNAPVRFIGVGEKIEDLEKFNSKNFVSQLLGMGDIETLLEKAKMALENQNPQKMKDKFLSGDFDLDDLYEQTSALGKMGGFSKIMNLIPGMSSMKIDKNTLNEQEGKTKKWKFLMNSMTNFERKNPQELNNLRIERICKGSGCEIFELREMLKQYKMMKKMMSSFGGKGGNMDEGEMQNMMGSMDNPQEMMKMAKKMGIGGKMLKNFKKK